MPCARASIVRAIFDKSTKDLSYILASEELLNAHIKYIEESPYDERIAGPLDASAFQVDEHGKHPLKFESFPMKYRYIYARWKHIIRCCYDPNYESYKYFGAKGIKMSDDFLDSKKFCIWCLKNGLTRDPFKYDQYLIRKNKYKEYSFENCQVVTEKELHECKSPVLAFHSLYVTRKYQEFHDDSVSFMTYYTRYYMYDMDPDSAGSIKGGANGIGGRGSAFTFKPVVFYKSVATEKSCPLSVFLCRIHDAYLTPGFRVYPYSMLNPKFSIRTEARKQKLRCYKELWEDEQKKKNNNYINNTYVNNENEIYKDTTDNEIYTNDNGIYS